MVCKALKGVEKVSGDAQTLVCRELGSHGRLLSVGKELSRAARSSRTGSSKYTPIIGYTGGCTGRWVWLNWE